MYINIADSYSPGSGSHLANFPQDAVWTCRVLSHGEGQWWYDLHQLMGFKGVGSDQVIRLMFFAESPSPTWGPRLSDPCPNEAQRKAISSCLDLYGRCGKSSSWAWGMSTSNKPWHIRPQTVYLFPHIRTTITNCCAQPTTWHFFDYIWIAQS